MSLKRNFVVLKNVIDILFLLRSLVKNNAQENEILGSQRRPAYERPWKILN